jgi:hypothetical protein
VPDSKKSLRGRCSSVWLAGCCHDATIQQEGCTACWPSGHCSGCQYTAGSERTARSILYVCMHVAGSAACGAHTLCPKTDHVGRDFSQLSKCAQHTTALTHSQSNINTTLTLRCRYTAVSSISQLKEQSPPPLPWQYDRTINHSQTNHNQTNPA